MDSSDSSHVMNLWRFIVVLLGLLQLLLRQG